MTAVAGTPAASAAPISLEISFRTDADIGWIVCCGETREVIGGQIACPRLGMSITAANACDSCHLLAWRADERDHGAVCAIPIDAPEPRRR